MRAIDTLHPTHTIAHGAGALPRRLPLLVLVVVSTALLLAVAAPAFASETSSAPAGGQAAVGEPLFYPCTSCHPLNGPVAGLPNGFKKHQIQLVGHDKLGAGSAACMACHDEPSKDPSKLKLIDGSFTDIKGETAGVCQRCHFDKYSEWKSGVHGKSLPKCTASGCHDPHTPSWIYAEPLLPFVGTGFEVRAVSDRRPFRPLASPPIQPRVETPWWLSLATAAGGAWILGVIAFLTLGRAKKS